MTETESRHVLEFRGRYVDRWERREDRVWRIAYRGVVLDGSRTHEISGPDRGRPPAFGLDPDEFIQGKRTREDAAYVRLPEIPL
jgi:hypothetical protein